MTSSSQTVLLLMATVALPLAGCASGGSAALPETASVVNPVETPDDMSCKKLAGLVQVRLLQIRDYDARNQSSLTSRAIQSASAVTFGGSKKGINTSAEHADDLQSLKTYNDELKSKGCKSFDLEKELSIHDPKHTPTATVAAPQQAAVSASQD